MADLLKKRAMKRLNSDMKELEESPVANVSAVPLDSDIFEWHCNFMFEGQLYHILLFFPNNYPYRSPSAEFMPPGFMFMGGATKPGRRGVQVCLSIFSDFAEWHTEWADEKSAGWSPGYTVQTVLLNMVSFLGDMNAPSYVKSKNLELSKKFKCKECGHTYNKPFPPFPDDVKSSVPTTPRWQIVDYISKEQFKKTLKPKTKQEMYGYGLIKSGPDHRPALTTPCEFLTGESFYGMKDSEGKVKSIMKEDLSFFLPLFINPTHGENIKTPFEECMRDIAKILPGIKRANTPIEDIVLRIIPNLMAATVVEFSKGTQHTSDNHLSGYFALHRLLLWAINTYPNMQKMLDEKLEKFISDSENRSKKACAHIGEWLMLLSGSEKYNWQDAASAYLSESWRRNVMWYVKEDKKLGLLDTPQAYRIQATYKATEVSRKILAFQVLFLDIAMPKKMKRAQVIKRYDENSGFPTPEMVTEMKDACDKISKLATYKDWFNVVKLKPLTDEEIQKQLLEAVEFAINTDGYHWSFWKNAGGWPEVLKVYRAAHPDKVKEKKGKDAKGKEDKKATTEKAPAKKEAAGRGRGKKRPAPEDSEEEEMEVDDEPPKKGAKGGGRGRKAAKVEEPPAKGRGRGRGRGKKK